MTFKQLTAPEYVTIHASARGHYAIIKSRMGCLCNTLDCVHRDTYQRTATHPSVYGTPEGATRAAVKWAKSKGLPCYIPLDTGLRPTEAGPPQRYISAGFYVQNPKVKVPPYLGNTALLNPAVKDRIPT